MLRAARAKRWPAAVVLAFGLALAGCGGDDFANDPPPPPATAVGAVVTVKSVTVSPARFGAGTIELLASNQTATSQRVQLRSVRLTGGGAALAQSTGPINPGGTATLKAQLREGIYVVSVRTRAIEPATIAVGAPGTVGPDRLLQP
jgi:hypothetical protein